jgi:MFS family permease
VTSAAAGVCYSPESSCSAVASVLCGVAPTLGQLIAARAAQGCGAAIMIALSMALVGEAVPQARTGSAMGLLGTMSAIGTALGPSLGGVLIAELGWRAIFLLNVPLGILTFLLAHRHLSVDRREPRTECAGFDTVGMLLLALTLAAYALAMTMAGTPASVSLNMSSAVGCRHSEIGLFVLASRRERDCAPDRPWRYSAIPHLRAGLAMSALVATVIMTTLVVGPFYLARALGLDAPLVGLVMSAGPLAAALSGVPAGRSVDRFGAPRMTIVGLIGVAAGSCMLSVLPTRLGISGYLAPMIVITASYALFQTANNSAVMSVTRPAQRGVISGMLGLARNLGLITGASVLGAVFALAAATPDIATAPPEAIARGMRITFAVAALLAAIALTIAVASRAVATRPARDEFSVGK